jgi:hypothetical protein
MVDYMTMSGPELLQECGDDAVKWAAAFCQYAKHNGLEVDEGWMISWFANAIETACDKRMGTGPCVLPDGSAFFVGVV